MAISREVTMGACTQLALSPGTTSTIKFKREPDNKTMVSGDSLNYDCLQLIFVYLYSNDLVSVSLVSRSFLAAAVPKLYRNLIFKLSQAKRYRSVSTRFDKIPGFN